MNRFWRNAYAAVVILAVGAAVYTAAVVLAEVIR